LNFELTANWRFASSPNPPLFQPWHFPSIGFLLPYTQEHSKLSHQWTFKRATRNYNLYRSVHKVVRTMSLKHHVTFHLINMYRQSSLTYMATGWTAGVPFPRQVTISFPPPPYKNQDLQRVKRV
jgi:hypothetical protein